MFFDRLTGYILVHLISVVRQVHSIPTNRPGPGRGLLADGFRFALPGQLEHVEFQVQDERAARFAFHGLLTSGRPGVATKTSTRRLP